MLGITLAIGVSYVLLDGDILSHHNSVLLFNNTHSHIKKVSANPVSSVNIKCSYLFESSTYQTNFIKNTTTFKVIFDVSSWQKRLVNKQLIIVVNDYLAYGVNVNSFNHIKDVHWNDIPMCNNFYFTSLSSGNKAGPLYA